MQACDRHQQWGWSDKAVFSPTAIKSLEIAEPSCWFLVGTALVLICIKLSSVLAELATVTASSMLQEIANSYRQLISDHFVAPYQVIQGPVKWLIFPFPWNVKMWLVISHYRWWHIHRLDLNVKKLPPHQKSAPVENNSWQNLFGSKHSESKSSCLFKSSTCFTQILWISESGFLNLWILYSVLLMVQTCMTSPSWIKVSSNLEYPSLHL